MSPWIHLIVAGLLEITWAVGLKYTHGFTKPLPSVLTITAIASSMFLLAKAAQSIPLGTAYGVWVGIGAVGSAVAGAALFNEALSPARIVCIVALIGAIIGLKLTSSS